MFRKPRPFEVARVVERMCDVYCAANLEIVNSFADRRESPHYELPNRLFFTGFTAGCNVKVGIEKEIGGETCKNNTG